MGKAIPAQHPAVVLRSQYRQLRSLVAVLVVAVAGLSTTLVFLSVDEDQVATTATSVHPSTAQLGDPLQSRTQPTRQTGGVDESAVAATIGSTSRSYPTLADPFHSPTVEVSSQSGAISAPDEAKIAASLAKHSDVGPEARARAYQQALRSMTPEQVDATFGTR